MPNTQSTPTETSQIHSSSELNSHEGGVLERVAALRRQLTGLTTLTSSTTGISTGCIPLDRLLPGGNLRPGIVLEWLTASLWQGAHRDEQAITGAGGGALVLALARQVLRGYQHQGSPQGSQQGVERPGCLVVSDRAGTFYPPAALAMGIEPRELIVVRPATQAEELWALDQALRCPGVHVVVAWLDKLDPRALRRLQLAAEGGGTLALFLRPAHVQPQPTWSDAQFLVEPQPRASYIPEYIPDYISQGSEDGRFLRLTLVRQRSRAATSVWEGTSVEIELDGIKGMIRGAQRRHESRHLHMAPRVARAATPRRSTGA